MGAVSEYKIYRRLSGGADWVYLDSVAAGGAKEYTDTTSDPDLTYDYLVVPHDAAGNPEVEVAPPLLLDTVTGAACAYSTRKLRTAYAGSAIRVRRSSDSAETDVSFDGAGEVSLSSTVSAGGSFSTWVGANSAFVKTWYDQSGNARNLTQASSTLQPRIVNAGVLVVNSTGKAVIEGDTSDDIMSVSFTHNQPVHRFMVARWNAINASFADGASGVNSANLRGITANTSLRLFAGNALTYVHGSTLLGVTRTIGALINGASSSLKVDGNAAATGNAGSTNPGGVVLFNSQNGASPANGWIGEHIAWGADKSADAETIRLNQKAYWGTP